MGWLQSLENLFERPKKVLAICLIFLLGTFILDGSFYQLWSLYSQHRFFEQQVQDHREKAQQLDYKIEQAQQVEFIERQALDQLDLVAEGDLIFVFSEPSPDGL